MLLHHVNVMFVSSVVSAAAFCFVISVRCNAMSLEQNLCVAIGLWHFVCCDWSVAFSFRLKMLSSLN